MNILVTGGAGYIGAELVFNLAKQPNVERIVVYDNLSRGNYNLFISSSNKIGTENVEFVHGDLLDSRKLKKALKDIDVVYHLAARVADPFQNVDSHVFEQTNNWGTAELVYAVEETPTVKKFVYLSSLSVYGGSSRSNLVTEDTAPNPRTYYAISKMRGEDHVNRLFDKMDTVVIRAGNVYGYSPAIRFDSVINKFLFDSHFKGRIQIHGSGKQSRSFIKLSKLVDALVFLLGNHVPNNTYNLTDKNVSVLDLVDNFKEIYPSLEFIFINQHLELRDLKVDPSTKFTEYFPLPESNLKQDILEIKDLSFAF